MEINGNATFAPVIASCPIDVRNLDVKDTSQCRMLKLRDVKEYLLLKIRYIDAEEFDVFLSQQQSSPLIFLTFIFKLQPSPEVPGDSPGGKSGTQ